MFLITAPSWLTQDMEFTMDLGRVRTIVPINFRIFAWSHFCVSVDLKTRLYRLAYDGQVSL